MGSINKLFIKVLARRLREVLPYLVSVNQQASVNGRQIADARLIAFELVDSRRKSRKPGLMFKLDIEKAFDNVSWNCLLNVLSKLCFRRKWQDWIRGVMCSPMISLLINGESKGYFPTCKGLRQGDLLSSGLFVLVMDILSFMIAKLKEEGRVSGFYMDERNSRGEVNHLLFADDTLIFCDADYDQILNILATRACFQAVTGLKINLEKTIMFTVGNVPNPDYLAAIFGCKWSREPSKYLGFPLGAKANAISTWSTICDNYQKRLDGWKRRYLSLGGRLTLNKAILSNQLVYYFSLLREPAAIIKNMEKTQCKFIWSGPGDNHKVPLVKWDICKAPKERGDLGVIDLSSFNKAMLSKWIWRYTSERGSWWRSLIEIKYSNTTSS
ncbi:unnamed protein product [Linum trigynum]|uniref:Reverse transcriptase domain-containing protein n=1 Tax=Linum trigynum TaxID=586398 RepID=A0AAV2CAY4_9ROSI